MALAALLACTPMVSGSTAYAAEVARTVSKVSYADTQVGTLQHVEAPDSSRSIDAVSFQGSTAISTVHMLPGDQLRLSEDQKTITWLSLSGETVATLDATSGGRTPLNWFEVSGNQVELHFFKDRIACGKAYAGAATFGVAWELGVCTPLGAAFLPAGIVCGVGTALVSPLIPWDNACKR